MAGVDRRAVLGRHITGINDVFHTEWHTVQWTTCAALIEGARDGQDLLGVQILPRLHVRLALVDTFETGLGNHFAGRFTRCDGVDNLGGGQGMKACCQAVRCQWHSGVSSHHMRQFHAISVPYRAEAVQISWRQRSVMVGLYKCGWPLTPISSSPRLGHLAGKRLAEGSERGLAKGKHTWNTVNSAVQVSVSPSLDWVPTVLGQLPSHRQRSTPSLMPHGT